MTPSIGAENADVSHGTAAFPSPIPGGISFEQRRELTIASVQALSPQHLPHPHPSRNQVHGKPPLRSLRRLAVARK